jgi:hypothetical protein
MRSLISYIMLCIIIEQIPAFAGMTTLKKQGELELRSNSPCVHNRVISDLIRDLFNQV